LGEQKIVQLEEVGCKLYDERQCNPVYELRYKIFVKARMCSHSIFPPTSAALKNHIKRANYQVHIWKPALEPQTPDEGPEDQGWKLRKLEIV